MRIKRSFAAIAFLLVAGCASSGGIYHTVGKGETLWRICHRYGADVNEVAEINHIKDPADIEAGTRLFIPRAKKRPGAASFATSSSAEKDKKIPVDRKRFIWPVKGEVARQFGIRDGIRSDGIDVMTKDNAAIKASDDGQVVYVNDGLKSHGNIIIIKHRDGFYTVYSHNKENLVTSGKNITKGDVIGTSGEGGSLHFEIRHGKRALDPLFYLP
ncbi:MAG: M23 family metallopeptidase [Deltaproteobacteria bacterium]|nr:M23 family metallopeptidase [Deltaproteobacteria bacterium]